MRETVQSPVSRKTLCARLEDQRGIFMDIQTNDGSVLTLYDDTLFPEISVLFVGDAEKFNDTVEVCGMYDKKAHEFRFVSDRLASIADGISDMERWTGPHTSEDVYARISSYAKEAVTVKGYRFESEMREQFAAVRQDARSALSAMIDYAAVLAARGEADAVLDTRDLAREMSRFWRDPVYDTYERGYEKVERQYLEQFDQAVSAAMRSGQAPAFGSGKAYSVLRGLAVHAEEVTQNEDAFSVWECCRLARRVAGDHPDQCEVFNGDFTADYSERFTKFGSQDWEHLQEGWMLGKYVLVFNSPLPDGQTPEGWHSYHLAGRNLSHVDRLLKAVPEKDYVGTVLSPHVLIRASYQTRQFQNHFGWYGGCVSLAEFCEKNHLPQPDVSGVAFGRQDQAAAPQMTMGGMC